MESIISNVRRKAAVMGKVHWLIRRKCDFDYLACDWKRDDDGNWRATPHKKLVTCKNCLRALRKEKR